MKGNALVAGALAALLAFQPVVSASAFSYGQVLAEQPVTPGGSAGEPTVPDLSDNPSDQDRDPVTPVTPGGSSPDDPSHEGADGGDEVQVPEGEGERGSETGVPEEGQGQVPGDPAAGSPEDAARDMNLIEEAAVENGCADDWAALDELAAANRDALPDGTYALVAGNTMRRKVVEVAGGSAASGANVRLGASTAAGFQRWIVTHDEQGYLTITNAASGNVLDVAAASTELGANVQQYASNGTRSQKWVAVPRGDGGFTLYSALCLDRVLDIAGGSFADATNVQIFSSNNSEAQQFTFVAASPTVGPGERIEALEDGFFSLRPAHAQNMALDVANASWDNGANVQIFDANGTMAQLFSFEYHDGYYLVRNLASGRVLDIDAGDVVPGTNVQQWQASGTNANQLFAAHVNDDGTYTFINKATGLALDVAGGSSARGVNVDAFTPNGSAAQRFVALEQDNLIAEGLYTMSPAPASGLALDITGASTSDNANAQLYVSNGSFAQKWLIAPVEGVKNTYTFENVASAKVLAAARDGNVVQCAKDGSASQQWTVRAGGEGMVFESVAYPGKVLDVDGGVMSSGRNVRLFAANDTPAQSFRLRSASATIPDGTYTIRMASSPATVLDVANGSVANGANVQVWGSNDSGAQKWDFTRNEDGSYTIVNSKSRRALDVLNCGIANGTNVQVWEKNNLAAQKWYLSYTAGGFRIQSALSPNVVLDISGGKPANGTNVQVYADNGSAAQRFLLSPTTYVPELPPDQLDMYNRAQAMYSNTDWLVLVDTARCRTGVFYGRRGDWQLKHYWLCSPGAWSTPTVLGEYTVQNKGYSFGQGYTCYYWTQFYGDYLFHSILYNQGTHIVQDGRLGMNLSHGCVRLDINNAKWIYDNIPRGTKVFIYR